MGKRTGCILLVKPKEDIMISKRMFLIGAGSLISAPFVTGILAHVRDTGEPFLIPPLKAEEHLHVYPDYSGETNQFRITLGPDQYDPPRMYRLGDSILQARAGRSKPKLIMPPFGRRRGSAGKRSMTLCLFSLGSMFGRWTSRRLRRPLICWRSLILVQIYPPDPAEILAYTSIKKARAPATAIGGWMPRML
jgi:hypothetical protein